MARIVNPIRSSSVAAHITAVAPIASVVIMMSVIAVSMMMEEGGVDVYRVAPPARSPPPETPASPTTKTEAEIEADSESKSVRGVVERGIVAIDRRTPDIKRIVSGDVNDLWVGRLYDDNLLPALVLGGDNLFRCRTEAAVGSRPGAHALDRVHDIGLLCQEGVPEISGPPDILIEPG